MEIYIDGDACPVKAEVERVATRHGLTVYLVSNGGLRPSSNPRFRHVTVAHSADAADDWIAEHIGPNDIAITADIPLAARCLAKAHACWGQAANHSGRTVSAWRWGCAIFSVAYVNPRWADRRTILLSEVRTARGFSAHWKMKFSSRNVGTQRSPKHHVDASQVDAPQIFAGRLPTMIAPLTALVCRVVARDKSDIKLESSTNLLSQPANASQ